MTSPLFERQATGGVVARTGFGYQDAFVLERLPAWVAQGAFSHVVSEVLGDVEVRYFRPGGGTCCVMYEAKNHQLPKREFWGEIENFQRKHSDSPNEYVRFALVCGDYLDELQPVLMKLSRLRTVGISLNADSTVRSSAEDDILRALIDGGAPEGSARFVLERVSFEIYSDANARDTFVGMFSQHLPSLAELRSAQVTEIRNAFERLVTESVQRVVHRADLERAIEQVLQPSEAELWHRSATALELTEQAGDLRLEQLGFAVGRFNGPQRGILGFQPWAELQQLASEVGDFLKSSRQRPTVKVDGKQRMSLACVLGFCFSATRGFQLEVEHNGRLFRTDNHERVPHPFFDVTDVDGKAAIEEGVIAIGFPTALAHDIATATDLLGLADLPRLLLQSERVIADEQSLNTAVAEAKTAVSDFRSRHGLTRLHLFVKAPSVFAMVLGHRLNALGSIQLYDWVETAYMATARLQ